jgi:hypothetical protein
MRRIVNPSTEKEIERLKKRFMPAPETKADRRLRARMDAGLQRFRASREAPGLSLPSDEQSGRTRAQLQFVARKTAEALAAQEPGASSPLAQGRGGKPRSTKTSLANEMRLAAEIAKFYDDPLGFVLYAYTWGEKGTKLKDQTGPDDNQKQFLIDLGEQVKVRGFNGKDPVMPILMTATSGHGTGKSVMGAWIADWILSTRPDSRGTVTAGTRLQLKSRTWSQIQHWTKLCITGHWFNIQAQGVYHKLCPDTWNVMPQTCKEQNAQAFAGQHAATSTGWYMFDEASQVPDAVWTVAKGGLTDGEPIWFAWGQPERNTGSFYEVNFGKEEHRWNHRRIDSRTSRFVNKPLMQEWLDDYGEDSDFYRVRVLGLPPTADELQFIDRGRILTAQKRAPQVLPDEPLICGVDVSGGGSAWTVCAFRRGLDARSIPRIRLTGEQTRNRDTVVGILSNVLGDQRPGRKVAAMFIDIAFGAAIYERLRALGFSNVFEVDFGLTHTPDRAKANMRAYMWDRMKDWLLKGAIEADEKLMLDLSSPGYGINRSNKLVLESKAEMRKRGLASPDDGDALALTFAQPVAPAEKETPDEDEEFTGISGGMMGGRPGGWMRCGGQ